MAHFAKIENGIVTQVVAVHDNEVLDNGVESEAKGAAFLKSLYGAGTMWVQCSYTGSARKQYPGRGDAWDAAAGRFVRPRPYASWSLGATGDWKPPTPEPAPIGGIATAQWDEKLMRWKNSTGAV